jgi:hypothetical protein
MGMIERPQWYVQRFINAGLIAGFQIQGVELQCDSDAPFRATGIAVYVFNSAGTPVAAAGNIGLTLRLTRPDGTWVQKRLLSTQALNPYDAAALIGAGGQTAPYFSYFSPLHPNILYPAGASVQFDLQALPTITDARVLIVLCGTKLFDSSLVWSPTYPARYSARPFFGFSVQINVAALPVLNMPVPTFSLVNSAISTVNADADFVWQFGSQTDQPASALSPVGVARGLGFKIRDWSGKGYMNDFVPIELVFGFDNTQTPGLVYPEIYIPRNQQLSMDIAAL